MGETPINRYKLAEWIKKPTINTPHQDGKWKDEKRYPKEVEIENEQEWLS